MHLITYLTRIQFGPGALSTLHDEIAASGASRPMIVADRGVIAAGLAERVTAAYGGPLPVFDDCPENPTEEAAVAAAAFGRSHEADAIVAVGGGSPIDLAKAAALLMTHDGPLARYAMVEGGAGLITDRKPPVFAVPTTAGTGSEVGRAALISFADGRKLAVLSPHMYPRAAICDPELTLGLPPRLTAATGMDAVTHCIETFLSPRFNPPADAIALDGLGRATGAIRRATENGRDGAAREAMMMAALEGGLTFQKGLGAVHALSHPLGGLKHRRLHHGTLNAVLLPHVLRFNAPAVEAKLPRLRAAMGLADGADVADAVADLVRSLGLPATLSAMGVERADLAGIAQAAMVDHSTPTNPSPIDAAAYATLLEAAL